MVAAAPAVAGLAAQLAGLGADVAHRLASRVVRLGGGSGGSSDSGEASVVFLAGAVAAPFGVVVAPMAVVGSPLLSVGAVLVFGGGVPVWVGALVYAAAVAAVALIAVVLRVRGPPANGSATGWKQRLMLILRGRTRSVGVGSGGEHDGPGPDGLVTTREPRLPGSVRSEWLRGFPSSRAWPMDGVVDRATVQRLIRELVEIVNATEELTGAERRGILLGLRRMDSQRHVLAAAVDVLSGVERKLVGEEWAFLNSFWGSVTRPDDYSPELAAGLERVRAHAMKVLQTRTPESLTKYLRSASMDSPRLLYLDIEFPDRYRGGLFGDPSRTRLLSPDRKLFVQRIGRDIAAARSQVRNAQIEAADRLLGVAEAAVVDAYQRRYIGRRLARELDEALHGVRTEIALHAIVQALRGADLSDRSFAVIGGMAVQVWTGAPRQPKDVDIAVVIPRVAERWQLLRALESSGFARRREGKPKKELTGRLTSGPDGDQLDPADEFDDKKPLTFAGLWTQPGDGRRSVVIELFFDASGAEEQLVGHARRVEAFGVTVPVASIATLIVSKMVSGRPKDQIGRAHV